jgi:diacylglycerol kinase (CTP)
VTRARGPTLRAEAARKAIHLGTAVLPVAWAFETITTAQLRFVLSAACAVALAVELARFRWRGVGDAFTARVGAMLRAHEHVAISGATWLALAMCLVVWIAPRAAGTAALWAAAVGDAAAALVGRGVQHLRRVARPGKSLVGSAAAFAASAAGIAWLTPAAPWQALLLGGAAAAAEWPACGGDDNVRVALVVAAAAALLGLR